MHNGVQAVSIRLRILWILLGRAENITMNLPNIVFHTFSRCFRFCFLKMAENNFPLMLGFEFNKSRRDLAIYDTCFDDR